jgi:hypothetical protein
MACSWAGCEEPATAWVFVQWTLVDFLEYYACELHLVDVNHYVHKRRVDGHLPVAVTWHNYEPQLNTFNEP